MNILVIGASGRVGNMLVKKLFQEKHSVVGATRQDKELFDSQNYTQINLDLLADVEEIENTIHNNLDAIYFVSGSGGKNLLQVDLHGAIKTMQVAEKISVKRYIMLSSLFTLEPKRWNEQYLKGITNYNIAKRYADLWLINNTALDYSILQAGLLKEIKGSGKIKVNVENPGENSIENVATTLVEVLENQSASKKVITMHDGDKTIKEAISEL